MFCLAAADTLAGVASAASQVTCTIAGMELSSGGVEVYKKLYQGQLAASAATIYTCPGSNTAFVKSISVVNNDTVTRTFQLFQSGTAAANAITPVITLAPSAFAYFIAEAGWFFFNAQGQVQTSFGTFPSLDNWGITGSKGDTMDRVYCPEVNTTLTTTGQIYLQAIWLAAGTVVNNVSFFSATTAASVPTHYCFALYDINRNLLATTADQTSTAWAANTIKTLAVTAPYTIPTTGLYYLAFMMVATTVPTMKGGPARTDGTLSFTAPIISGVSGTAYSTGTAPASVTAIGAKVTTSVWGCVT